MEYVYIPQPLREKEQKEEKKCPLSTDAHWAESVVDRGYFLTVTHAIQFLESHRAVTSSTKVNTDNLFTRVNPDDNLT